MGLACRAQPGAIGEAALRGRGKRLVRPADEIGCKAFATLRSQSRRWRKRSCSERRNEIPRSQVLLAQEPIDDRNLDRWRCCGKQLMVIAAKGGSINEFRAAGGRAEFGMQPVRQTGCEELVVLRVNPEHRRS